MQTAILNNIYLTNAVNIIIKRTFLNQDIVNWFSPQYLYTDRFKAVLLLWFLTVTCSCCPYLYFGSAVVLVTYFVNFR